MLVVMTGSLLDCGSVVVQVHEADAGAGDLAVRAAPAAPDGPRTDNSVAARVDMSRRAADIVERRLRSFAD